MLTWKKEKDGESGSLGVIKLFNIFDPGHGVELFCNLPGESMQGHRGHFVNIDVAKSVAEDLLKEWLKKTGLGAEKLC
jgi:hypothetical protein